MSTEHTTDAELLGTDFRHNTDLDPPEAYLATVPRVRAALRNPELIGVFRHYDRIANSKQKLFRGLGMLSLVLACVSLLGIDAELCVAALYPAFHSARVTATFEFCALLSIAIASAALAAGTRTQWLTARYLTETIRQWHFQMFLDGQLMTQAFADPAKFQAELAIRWARLMNRAATAKGEMDSVLLSDAAELQHPLKPYGDAQTAEEAMRAYSDLRINKQLSYFTVSKEVFVAHDGVSESLARWFLVSALLLAAAQLVLLKYAEPAHAARVILFASAIACVIFTAVIRVYRSALAVPQQRERYETKWVRLVALQSAFDTAASSEKKLEIMKEAELTEMEEMREFLRQMRRASYIL
jgi:hypothetical protein